MIENEWRKPGLSDERNAELDAWRDEYESPSFQHGMDVGSDLGFYKASSEAQRAYEMGEIELWLAFQKPKTMEDWDAWDAEHGDLHGRWDEKKDEDGNS